ncbi:hypothetical protein VTJ04DRAFT_3950 [Mycothermus thermophilus]|uniref:uncharacterized protein n=1 Tax=Humicola insolens TaxID=85995 RepID=UPI00374263D2
MHSKPFILVFAMLLPSSVHGAATKWYSDPECKNLVGKQVYNWFATGDAIIPPHGVRAIKVDSITSIWFAYDGTAGPKCRGHQLRALPENMCITISSPVDSESLPIRCTRICSGAIGGTSRCAPIVIE